MNASDIRRIVESEIGGDWSRTNDHRVDLRKCVIEPRLVSCKNTFPKLRGGKPLNLWIVLEEHPGTTDGYLIVFDEANHRFGLADYSGTTPVFLGFHGSFWSAFVGM